MKIKNGLVVALTVAVCHTICASDVFNESGNIKTVHLDGVPNFDQLRDFNTAPFGDYPEAILGLANGGKQFCVPTSTTEWMSFLANRGYPNLHPGVGANTGSWETGHAGLAQYNLVNFSIVVMSINMNTNVYDGTHGNDAQIGAQNTLDASYPGQFTTINLSADNSGFPRISDLIDSELSGNLVVPFGGWYTDVITRGVLSYFRDGGHATAMAEARFVGGPDNATIGLANPASGDKTTRQSPQMLSQFTTSANTVATVTRDDKNVVIPDSLKYFDVDFLDKSSKWILDGALEIQPFSGYTIHHNFISELNPGALVNQRAFQGGYRSLYAHSEHVIKFATKNPLSGLTYYMVDEDVPRLYSFRPLSGDSQLITSFFNEAPIAMVFGASFRPYALFPDGSICQINLATGDIPDRINLPIYSDRLVFDPAHNMIAAINTSIGKYILLDKNLKQVGPMQSFDLPKGYGPIFTAFGPKGHLYIFQPGDPYLAENIPTTNGRVISKTHFLPAVQNAESFSVDDWGRMFFSLSGKIQVVDGNGSPLVSPFNGLPGGEMISLSHSMNNWDPKIHRRNAWRDRILPGAFRSQTVLNP